MITNQDIPNRNHLFIILLIFIITILVTSCNKEDNVEPISSEVASEFTVDDLSGVWSITNMGDLKEVYIEHRGDILTVVDWDNRNSRINGDILMPNGTYTGLIINARRIELEMKTTDFSTIYKILTR